MPKFVTPAVSLTVAITVLMPLAAIAQTLPGGATPGGAMPDVSEQRRPVATDRTSVIIPPVLDRLEDEVDSGPKIPVRRFEVYANRSPATAWRGGRYLVDVERQLAAALSVQPPGGYTLGQIGQITRQIEADLREKGMLLAQVFIPVQQVVDGLVAVEIMEGRVGKVIAEGNERYSDEVLKRPLDELANLAVDNDSIERSVLLLRDYPGIAVAGVFSPGEARGTTDLTLRVQDEDPRQFSISVDNHGSEFTGENRTLIAADFNNPLGRADVLSLAVLQTWSPRNGTYGSVAYELPVFGPGISMNLGYVQNQFDVSGQSALNNTNISGDTSVAQLGMARKFIRSRGGNLTGAVALLSKRAEIVDESIGETQGSDKLTVLDVALDFDLVDTRFRGVNTGLIGFSHGYADFLGSLAEGDPGVELGSSRRNQAGTFAGGKFDKWYAQLSRLQQLWSNSDLLLRATMQSSDDLLVSLEQYALGGPNSVRAYPPAEFLVDSGGFASVEWIVAAPGFSDRSAFRGYTWGELLRVSAYFDYAGGYLSEPAFGEQKTRDISGYGIGIDFRLPGTFWARLDVAKPRGSEKPSDGDDPQYYFSMNYSF